MAVLLAAIVIILLHSGCVKNTRYVPTGYCSLSEYTFGSTFDDTWKAAIVAVSENDIIKIMDKSTGILITEFGSVDAEEVSTLHTYIKGQKYKYVYTINMSEQPDTRTAVRVDVKLGQPVGIAILNETNAPLVQNYLRVQLFQRICGILAPGRTECDSIFTYPAGTGPMASRQSTDAEKGPKNDSEPDLTGQQIKEIQEKLAEAGYNPGAADGLMGNRTCTALRKYQQDHNLPPTGRISDQLLIALGLKDKQTEETPQPQETIMLQPVISAPVSETPYPAEILMDITGNDQGSIEKMGVIAEETEMKSQADPFSETVTSISGGSRVEILENSMSWAKVRFSGQEGYVLYDLIQPVQDDLL